ncbi:MAG: VanZ family protein [Bacteroidota bacterium]
MNKYLTGAILWALLILVLTLTPGKSVPNLSIFDYDKLGHAGIFLIQSYLLTTGLYLKSKTRSKEKYILIGSVSAVLYGFMIEYAQEFIPDRGMEAYDAVANIAGALCGVGLFYLQNNLWRR